MILRLGRDHVGEMDTPRLTRSRYCGLSASIRGVDPTVIDNSPHSPSRSCSHTLFLPSSPSYPCSPPSPPTASSQKSLLTALPTPETSPMPSPQIALSVKSPISAP